MSLFGGNQKPISDFPVIEDFDQATSSAIIESIYARGYIPKAAKLAKCITFDYTTNRHDGTRTISAVNFMPEYVRVCLSTWNTNEYNVIWHTSGYVDDFCVGILDWEVKTNTRCFGILDENSALFNSIRALISLDNL